MQVGDGGVIIEPLTIWHGKAIWVGVGEIVLTPIFSSSFLLLCYISKAKMNRAIHIARPEPDEDQLLFTAKAIFESMDCRLSYEASEHLKNLAAAYVIYCNNQMRSYYPNFHGLRDYYCMVKQIAKLFKEDRRMTPGAIAKAVARNFSGLIQKNPTAFDEYLTSITTEGYGLLRSIDSCNPRDLMRANL